MDTIAYLITLTTDTNLDKLVTTHKYLIAGGWAVLKLVATVYPMESNKIVDLLKQPFNKGGVK